MTKFTIEDLRDIAYRGSYDDLERELALQLLASMERAPVYLRPFGDDGETFVACDGDDERAITLYAAPQLPQPAGLSVPEGVLKGLLPDAEKPDFWFEHNGKIFFEGVKFNNAVFDACRAAMLQGAEQQNAQQNIPENIPTLREAVTAIRNSGIAIDAEKIQAEQDALNENVQELHETAGCPCKCRSSEKVQVLQAGWVAVPVDPTPEMQSAAAGAIRFDTTPINKLWTGNAVYKAMLAAAPQQGVK